MKSAIQYYAVFGPASSKWNLVKLKYESRKHTIDIINWAKEYCIDDYKKWHRVWVFKSKQDAVAFKLRWL